MRKLLLPLVVLVFSLTLIGCPGGGGSDEDDPPTPPPPPTGNANCPIAYNLPGDIGDFGTDPPDQQDLDLYSWQMFLALNAPAVGQSVSTTGDNRTLWGGSVDSPITATDPGFSSTDDLLLAVTDTSVPDYGTHYYPTECQEIPDHTSYRVLDEISKVDDGFFEAGKISVPNNKDVDVGLSSDPVVASNGTFVRYEILTSEVTYSQIVNNQWYLSSVLNSQTEALSFPCGSFSSGGATASPADPGIGAMTIKNAWMDATGLDPSKYHMENLLVYTNGSQNSNGENSCSLQKMALVGMHIAHKTHLQNGWTWSTFEHEMNAPNCTATPNLTTQNTACPDPDGTAYNFFPATADSKFASCNAVPAANGSGTNCDASWCADLPPNESGGYSQLCRQVPLATSDSDYSSAAQQSEYCNESTGTSVWSNYTLISTQWFTALDAATSCVNTASTLSPTDTSIQTYAPQVTLSEFRDTPPPPLCANSTDTNCVPYLANTSMESYERSNCMGCHTKAVVNSKDNTSPSTDMMFFLMLEVPAAPINQTGS